MKKNKLNRSPLIENFAFLILAALSTALLYFAPFFESKLTRRRVEGQMQTQESVFKQVLANNCRSLDTQNHTALEEGFAAKLFALPAQRGTNLCTLTVTEAKESSFGLVTHAFIKISSHIEGSNQVLFEEGYSISYPRPLVLLPLLLFFFGAVVGVGVWDLGVYFILYLFFLFGFNFIQLGKEVYRSAETIIQSDKNWLGITCLVLFLGLLKAKGKSFSKSSMTKRERILSQGFWITLGLWSPSVYSLLRIPFLRIGQSVKRINHFLTVQTIIAAVSLYFLLFQEKGSSISNYWQSLSYPRYFSLALFILLFFQYSNPRKKRDTPFWKIEGMPRHLACIFGLEIASRLWVPLSYYPALTRVSVALFLSQVSLSRGIQWKPFILAVKTPLAWVFLSALVSIISFESGVLDLAITLSDPQSHPSILTLSTFLSGIFIGSLTGSFSLAFFAMTSLVFKSEFSPLIRGAMLDGLLAGSLLSPFSLLNLVPSAIIGISVPKLIRSRVEIVGIPLVIATMIYSISSLNSVAILRPITFLFMCLLVFAYKLQKNGWKLSQKYPWTSLFSKELFHKNQA